MLTRRPFRIEIHHYRAAGPMRVGRFATFEEAVARINRIRRVASGPSRRRG